MVTLQEFTDDDARLLEEVFEHLWFDQKYVESEEFHSYLANYLYELLSEDTERDRVSRAIDNVHDLLYEWEQGKPYYDREAESVWIQGAHYWISEHFNEYECHSKTDVPSTERKVPLETMESDGLAHKIAASIDAMDDSDDGYDLYDQIPDGYEHDDWDD